MEGRFRRSSWNVWRVDHQSCHIRKPSYQFLKPETNKGNFRLYFELFEKKYRGRHHSEILKTNTIHLNSQKLFNNWICHFGSWFNDYWTSRVKEIVKFYRFVRTKKYQNAALCTASLLDAFIDIVVATKGADHDDSSTTPAIDNLITMNNVRAWFLILFYIFI